MEREKVIELARNLGWEYDEEDGHIYYDGTPITTMLTVYSRHLSKLVEQETLKRVLMECEAMRDDMVKIQCSNQQIYGASQAVEAIRSLKLPTN